MISTNFGNVNDHDRLALHPSTPSVSTLGHPLACQHAYSFVQLGYTVHHWELCYGAVWVSLESMLCER